MPDGSNSRERCAGRARVGVAVLFAVVLFASGIGVGSVAAQPDCGSITYAEYPDSLGVQTVEQLQCVGNNPAANYTLRSNIDASATGGWNNGTGFNPVENFRGTFDGNGHTIRDLIIDRPTEDSVGLFASTSDDALLTNVELRSVDITGARDVGALVGSNDGEVRDSQVSGLIEGEGERNVGGLVGSNEGGTVLRSSSSAEVGGERPLESVGGLVGRNTGDVGLSHTSSTVDGDEVVGGVVGFNLGTVRDTYSKSSVSGRAIVGGIVGQNQQNVGQSMVRTSYATGTVEGDSEVGGAIGLNDNANFRSLYFDRAILGSQASPGSERIGTPLTERQMTGEDARRTMEDLNFESIWVTVTNPDDYPILAWQTEESEPESDGGNGDDDGDGDGDEGESDGDSDGESADGEDGTDEETDDGTDDGDTEGEDGTDDDTEDETDGDTDTDGDADSGTEDGATDEETDSEDGTDEETEDETDDGTDGSEGMPGFGILAGVTALLGALLLSRRFVSG